MSGDLSVSVALESRFIGIGAGGGMAAGASHIAGGPITVASHLETARYDEELGGSKKRTTVVIRMVGDSGKQAFKMATIARLTLSNMRDKLVIARSRVSQVPALIPPLPVGRAQTTRLHRPQTPNATAPTVKQT